MYTPFKMKGKSPMVKKLIGKQHRLPEHLKAKIEAAPESPAKMKKKSIAKKKDGKVNPFSAEYKRMTVSQRRKKYNKRDEAGNFDKTKDTYKKIGSDKKGTLRTALDKVDKAISREKSYISIKKGEDKKINVKIKKGDAPSNTSRTKKTNNSGSSSNSGYKSRGGGDPYKYKKNSDGSYSYIGPDGKKGTIKKGGGGYDDLEKSTLKMKKSSMKLKKKSATKMKKTAMKLKKKSATKMMKKK